MTGLVSDRQALSCDATDVARPSFPPPCVGSDARPLCVSDGAPRAPAGTSVMDGSSLDSRRRIGSAGDAALSVGGQSRAMSPQVTIREHKAMRAAVTAGQRRSAIASAMGRPHALVWRHTHDIRYIALARRKMQRGLRRSAERLNRLFAACNAAAGLTSPWGRA